MIFGVHPLIALGVLASTAATDAAYVFFQRSSQWQAPGLGGELERHLVFVIGICRDQLHRNAIYVLFAATGSWLGAFVSVTWLRRGHTEAVQTRHNPP